MKIERLGQGQGAGEMVEALTREEIITKIEELDNSDIINAAYKAYNKGHKSGYACIDLETGELSSVGLGQGESNQACDATYIVIYSIDQNTEFCACDILTEDELAEGKELETEDILNYIDYYFNDLDWDDINRQLNDWYGK